jgi:predicted glycogen debranching enzyme
MSRFDQSVCRDLGLASRREWLETNGLGGFASSTIAGLNTRRYHGLLVAATKPPVGRMVLLSKVEETLIIEGRPVDLSCNRYPGVVHPEGHLHLKEFRQDPFPVFVYEVDGFELEKSLFLVHGENTVVIQYELRGPATGACFRELRPLIAFRDYHSTTHENDAISHAIAVTPGLVECEPYSGLPKLSLAHTAAGVQPVSDWYRNFEYSAEQERGLDFREDLFCPAMMTFDLRQYSRPALIASTEAHEAKAAPRLRAAEIERRRQIVAAAPAGDGFVQTMVLAADQFLVGRGTESTVIAGYHWFSDWGRDTMIALPGLTLSTGRCDAARSILLAFAESADCGMLPNRFPDAGEAPEYNTVDATLWFFEAVRALAAQTGDYEFVRTRLWETLSAMIAWHERGTRYGIHADSDGLLSAGEPGAQLTWMDAKVGDWVVTPRHGKPVEILALWYNALRVMEDLAERFKLEPERAHYQEVADRAFASFTPLFWNEAAGCLYDVVNGDERDGSIRPNQIFAVSLFHKMLPMEKARSVVEVVERHLLTPYGLRSLAPSDPQYRGRYEGNPLSRDGGYHQGTVWPWLLGPFIRAYMEVNGRSQEARTQATQWMAELRRYVGEEGLGQIPEVFDGDAPHRAGGCIAQAWSVAELLRSYVEDVAVGKKRMKAAG